MTSELRIAAVIPARMAASRYPGKPLLSIGGLPMIEHVRRRALLCSGFSEVIVATCDNEIATAVTGFGGRVMMTSDEHVMASDRVAEAMQNLTCSHVVNVQGDEILILPGDLERMVEAIRKQPAAPYWNATALIDSDAELDDLAIVKCVVSQNEKILYCARDFSHLSDQPDYEPVRKILGILGYTREGLESFKAMTRTPMETTQSIDQSRVLEHDLELLGVRFSSGYPGINNQREERAVRAILEKDQEQQAILEKIRSM